MRKTPVLFVTRAILVTYKVLWVVGALWITVACTSGGEGRSSAASQDGRHVPFKEWQVIDTATGQPVSLDQWTALLLQQDIIYLGEEHHNRFHIDAAMTVLRRLKAEGRTPVLAMEMPTSCDTEPACELPQPSWQVLLLRGGVTVMSYRDHVVAT